MFSTNWPSGKKLHQKIFIHISVNTKSTLVFLLSEGLWSKHRAIANEHDQPLNIQNVGNFILFPSFIFMTK